MAAKSFLRYVTGKIESIQAIVASVGAGNDGDLVSLDSTGRFDPSVMPVGVIADVKVANASETLAAGDYVNFHDVATVTNVRKADNSNGREAHGFVLSGAAAASNATVYFEGPNTGLSGLTAGQRVYLGVTGGILTTPLVPVTDAGDISQLLGTAISATEVNTDIDDCIQL